MSSIISLCVELLTGGEDDSLMPCNIKAREIIAENC